MPLWLPVLARGYHIPDTFEIFSDRTRPWTQLAPGPRVRRRAVRTPVITRPRQALGPPRPLSPWLYQGSLWGLPQGTHWQVVLGPQGQVLTRTREQALSRPGAQTPPSPVRARARDLPGDGDRTPVPDLPEPGTGPRPSVYRGFATTYYRGLVVLGPTESGQVRPVYYSAEV